MGKRNFVVDFVEFFANIIDSEFFEEVHHTPNDPGRPVTADCPGYPVSFPPKLSSKDTGKRF
ncbi:MAG: hypothetical protein JRJ77_07065 [Deltaproteobacteria bacterium]|nr:hypothetical protein [Deltaproteobacteria bacterium]MBW2340999.1 hypothetical protein [Deltaproteobacteria bacterium]